MKLFFLFTVLSFLTSVQESFSQSDTIIKKRVRGIIFMPAYHSAYDECCPSETSIGYNDYFFPIKSACSKIFEDSIIDINIRSCSRIVTNDFRKIIKKQATELFVIDTALDVQWYIMNSFFIIPVEMDYKLFEDDFPKMLAKDDFKLHVKNGSRVRFIPNKKAIMPIRIKVLSVKPTGAPNKQKRI